MIVMRKKEMNKLYKEAKTLHQEFEKQLYENLLNWISTKQPAMKAVWTIQVSYLFTECIVESVRSIMKKIFYDNRARMDAETSKKTRDECSDATSER